MMISTACGTILYHSSVQNRGRNIRDKLTLRWVQHFMAKYCIVARKQWGKLLTSPVKKVRIEQEVAYYLGKLNRDLKTIYCALILLKI